MLKNRFWLFFLYCMTTNAPAQDFHLLSAQSYQKIISQSRTHIQELLRELQPLKAQDKNTQVAFLTNQLSDIPYSYDDGIGEGDWEPSSPTYQPHAVHINQHPVYRLDVLDCQTFVQLVLALLHAENLNEFDQQYLNIAYGAAGNPNGEIVRYYNRNNFIDGDFNPINEKHGFLKDVTSNKPLSLEAKTATAVITRQRWFRQQQQHLDKYVNVLHPQDGLQMIKRFKTTYSYLPFPKFNKQVVSISYLPKERIALLQADGSYRPNQALLDKIPTPAIAEIVSDPKLWKIQGRNIKESIGTELNVSHLGMLYRQTFKFGELIYRKTSCNKITGHTTCQVTPVTCAQAVCKELMFAHATNAYPRGYSWQKNNGKYSCVASRSSKGSTCNRVVKLPLYTYLTDYQYGGYWYMNDPVTLGFHIEQLQ